MKMMVEWKLTTAVMVTLALEAAGVLMWAGVTSERLSDVERQVAQQAQAVERLTRVEVQLQGVVDRLVRIEKAVVRP